MLDSQKLAIAAHLHVLLRRKTGRVTDTEWMVVNHEYACEVVRFARAKAREEHHDDLAEWAAKLEAVVLGTTVASAGAAPLAAAGPAPPGQTALDRLRERARQEGSYVRGLR